MHNKVKKLINELGIKIKYANIESNGFFGIKNKKAIIVKESRGTQESTNSEGKWEKKLITEDLRMALEDGCFFE